MRETDDIIIHNDKVVSYQKLLHNGHIRLQNLRVKVDVGVDWDYVVARVEVPAHYYVVEVHLSNPLRKFCVVCTLLRGVVGVWEAPLELEHETHEGWRVIEPLECQVCPKGTLVARNVVPSGLYRV